MNGYGGANYAILITLFPPDAKDRVTRLLKTKENIFFDVEKKKGNSQVTSGIHVPSVLNKSPFAPNVIQEKADVKPNPNINFKLPVSEDTSPRALLTNALDSVITDSAEKQKLQEYRENIEKLDEQEARLRGLKSQIKDMSFAPGPRDTQKIKSLREEAAKTENRINLYDKCLLRFETSAPLQRDRNRA